MILNEYIEISLAKGMVFKFRDTENEIVYQCSSITGKESIEVNGNIVSKSQNFRTYSEHTFFIKDIEYSVRLVAKSPIKGHIECSLNKNKELLRLYKLKYVKPSRNFWLRNIPPIIGGAAIGFGYAAKLISLWGGLFVLAVVIIGLTLWNKGHWECEVVTL